MKRLFTIISVILCSISLSGQILSESRTSAEYEKDGDAAHREYLFDKAISLYHKALENTTDSLQQTILQNKLLNSENGVNMLQYIVRPVVINTKNLPIEDFYLYIGDLEERGWIPIPNPFIKSSLVHPFYNAIYLTADSQRIIFSAPDQSGSWTIYTSSRIGDQKWSAPEILSEATTSSGDEIFPMLSPDGNTLFFASNGFAGMGGYDLFVSKWDSESGEWGIPENLGFPYSSTGNDFICHNLSDGTRTLLFSDRNCNVGEVTAFVLETITTPVKSPIIPNESPKEIASLAVAENFKQDNPSDHENHIITDSTLVETYNNYSVLVTKIKQLKGEYRDKVEKLAESRATYERANESDKEFIKTEIIEVLEKEAIALKRELDQHSKEMKRLEMEFLSKGVIPRDILTSQEDEIIEETAISKYKFTKKELGEIPYIEVENPKPQFDYSFKVLKEGQFALDNTLPDGLVYQIQIAVLAKKAKVKELKGLSPVFVRKLSSGKYLHTVGLFYTHSEALSNLNTVRKRGFSSAFIVAYNNGEAISVKKAKALEAKQKEGKGYSVVLSGYSEGLPATIMTIIRESCDKDISRVSSNGEVVYIVAPFEKKSEADALLKRLNGLGVTGAEIGNL